jgi:hypothetical protein
VERKQDLHRERVLCIPYDEYPDYPDDEKCFNQREEDHRRNIHFGAVGTENNVSQLKHQYELEQGQEDTSESQSEELPVTCEENDQDYGLGYHIHQKRVAADPERRCRQQDRQGDMTRNQLEYQNAALVHEWTIIPLWLLSTRWYRLRLSRPPRLFSSPFIIGSCTDVAPLLSARLQVSSTFATWT